MGYRDVIARGMSAAAPDPDWDAIAVDRLLKHLTAAGFAIVPTSMPEGMFRALLDDWEQHAAIAGGQGYRDIWSVALKSAQALA